MDGGLVGETNMYIDEFLFAVRLDIGYGFPFNTRVGHSARWHGSASVPTSSGNFAPGHQKSRNWSQYRTRRPKPKCCRGLRLAMLSASTSVLAAILDRTTSTVNMRRRR